MSKYTDVWKMDSAWLLMEFKRLISLKDKGETDVNVSYNVRDLEELIMHRLNEYEVDR